LTHTEATLRALDTALARQRVERRQQDVWRLTSKTLRSPHWLISLSKAGLRVLNRGGTDHRGAVAPRWRVDRTERREMARCRALAKSVGISQPSTEVLRRCVVASGPISQRRDEIKRVRARAG
jgi:hypothetical protein